MAEQDDLPRRGFRGERRVAGLACACLDATPGSVDGDAQHDRVQPKTGELRDHLGSDVVRTGLQPVVDDGSAHAETGAGTDNRRSSCEGERVGTEVLRTPQLRQVAGEITGAPMIGNYMSGPLDAEPVEVRLVVDRWDAAPAGR